MFGWIKRKRCKHQWGETRRSYNRSKMKLTEAGHMDSELMRELIFGITNVEMQCFLCGQIQVIRFCGKCGEYVDKEG
jgi:formylmethanofuran dehydrogenase subunit E